jgi:hypothetical protein
VLHVTAVALMFVSLLALLSTSSRNYADDIEDEMMPKRKRRRRHGDNASSLSPAR